MRSIKFLLICLALVLASAAFAPKAQAQSFLSTILSGGKSAGESAGAALRDIYDQYKADGKIDLQNVRTIKNVTVLANSIQGLKGQKITGSFCKDFAKGLVTGSKSLFSSSVSTNVTKDLLGMANNIDFSSLIGGQKKEEPKQNSTVISQASEVTSSLTNIFNLLK